MSIIKSLHTSSTEDRFNESVTYNSSRPLISKLVKLNIAVDSLTF